MGRVHLKPFLNDDEKQLSFITKSYLNDDLELRILEFYISLKMRNSIEENIKASILQILMIT